MQEQELKNLLKRIHDGRATDEEKAFLESWYLQYQEKDGVEYSADERAEDANAVWAKLKPEVPQHRQRRLGLQIAAAAAVFIVISISGYFILHKPIADTPEMAQNQAGDVTPGSNSATLTLANGQKVVLNAKPNGQIAVQGNMAVTKRINGQIQYQSIASNSTDVMINTVATKRKEQYKVVLSDGTSVWLNAASSITYPTAFTGRDRKVSITGEAYFEVAHNAEKPFKVSAKGQTIKVLGTHFNVNSYTDEPDVNTTLLEGSVKVVGGNGFKIIKPGQRTVFKNGQLSIIDANLEETVAWKNGYFRFNQEKIGPIMRKLARWYDIDVQFDGPISDDEFSGKISRFKNISEVLKALEYYKTVHFKIEGRRVTVSE